MKTLKFEDEVQTIEPIYTYLPIYKDTKQAIDGGKIGAKQKNISFLLHENPTHNGEKNHW